MSNTKGEHHQNYIVVLGKEWRNGRFDRVPAQCLKDKINNTVIISTPDAPNLNDKLMLDLMALTFPGPHLFLVRVDKHQNQLEEMEKWGRVFGEKIFRKMIYITDLGECSDKCISIKEDVIIKCKPIISADHYSTFSFEEFLNRRKEVIDCQARPQSSSAAGVQQKSQQLTLVLLGETGSGKSASGNTILEMPAFKSEPSSTPLTTECKMKTKSIYGTEVKVIDTPDFFDDDLQKPSSHILKCRELCREGGLCVYLLAIQIGRFTEGERNILERLEEALETRIRYRTIILFTRGDDLRFNIEEYVRNTNPHLQQLIEKCGKRYQIISNTTSVKKGAENQVNELMGKIVDLVGVTISPESVQEKKCVIA